MEKELKPFNLLTIIIPLLIIISVFIIINSPKETKNTGVEKLIHLKFENQIKNNILFSNINIDKKKRLLLFNC